VIEWEKTSSQLPVWRDFKSVDPRVTPSRTDTSLTMSDELIKAFSGQQDDTFNDQDLEEEIEDSKLEYQHVANAVKVAIQEAISKRTIQEYQRYIFLPLYFHPF